METELNLVKILKDVPIGTSFYSPVIGVVTLCHIDKNREYPIAMQLENTDTYCYFTKDGKLSDECECEFECKCECELYPSEENRDWDTFIKTHQHYHFEPFEKVLVKQTLDSHWHPALYGKYEDEAKPHHCGNEYWKYCIPFEGNEHLLYTIDNK